MSAPKVSVILPVFNVEKYLPQCLASIAAQTMHDFEAICVDDCGMDGSVDIVNEFCKKDDRFRLLRHTRRQRQGGARNTGIRAAAGKYIAFVDADDWILPYKLHHEYDAIESHSTNCVWSKFFTFSEEDGLVRDARGWNSEGGCSGTIHLGADNFGKFNTIPWNKLYRTDFIRKNALFFPEDIYYEDTGFYYKFFSLSPRVFVLDEPLYAYRLHPESVTMKTKMGGADSNELVAMYRDCYQFLQAHDSEEGRAIFLQFIIESYVLFLYSKHYKKQFVGQMQQFLGEIGLTREFDVSKAYELVVLNKSSYSEMWHLLYRPLMVLNQLNPSADLRRKWRKWIKVNCYAE